MAVSWNTEMKQLTPNVYAYVQGGGPGISNNGVSDAGIIIGDDAAMVVDGLQAPIPAKAFLAEIKRVNTKPLRHMVNTHFHGDHTAANQYYMPIQIIATAETRQLVMDQTAGAAPTFAASPGRAVGNEPRIPTLPQTTFTGHMTIYYGDLQIELWAPPPAHSPGDVLVYVPQHKVVFAGDCCFFYVAPHFWTGNGTGNLEVFDWIESLDVEWIVPGHGPVGTKQDLKINRGYLERLKSEAKKRFDAKMPVVDAAASIDMGEYKEWPEARDRLIGNTMRFYREFEGRGNTVIPPEERQVNLKAYLQKAGF